MAGSFAEGAARLAALAAVSIGWRPDDFWAATPAELRAILSLLAGEGGAVASGIGGADLGALMEQFPDD